MLRVNTLRRDNTLHRVNTANTFSRVVITQHIMYGGVTGAANTPSRFTIHGPITTRLTATLGATLLPGITAAAVDITVAVGIILVAVVITAAAVAVILVAGILAVTVVDTGSNTRMQS